MEVWAYGSRVNGTAHDGSDLDLVVRSLDGQPLPPNLIPSLRERIRNSNIPILVELRDWAKLPASFHESILVRHEVLYSAAVADREGQPS
jgi:predicted nucleotidyltransferase